MNKFAKILKEKQITQEQAALELETNQANISRWASGECLPEAKMMVKIMNWSNGEVQPNDWVLGSE